jgi:hypothetical protein
MGYKWGVVEVIVTCVKLVWGRVEVVGGWEAVLSGDVDRGGGWGCIGVERVENHRFRV